MKKFLLAGLLVCGVAIAQVPCTTVSTACEDWVTLGGGPARSPMA